MFFQIALAAPDDGKRNLIRSDRVLATRNQKG